jgi:hypothetical protein
MIAADFGHLFYIHIRKIKIYRRKRNGCRSFFCTDDFLSLLTDIQFVKALQGKMINRRFTRDENK